MRARMGGGWKTRYLEISREVEHIRFVFRDAKGREFGTRYTKIEGVYAEEPDDPTKRKVFYDIEPGHYYSYGVHATRNGQSFGGGGHGGYWFTTVEERDAQLRKYIWGAKRRARENEGK